MGWTCTGCGTPPPPVKDVGAGHEKLHRLLTEEMDIPAVIRPLERTLYVYVPVEHDIFQYRAARKPAEAPPEEGTPKQQLNFVEVVFRDGQFVIDYDISPIREYPKSLGYSSGYTDEFSRLNSSLSSAVYRSYNDLNTEEDPESTPVKFVRITIADTRHGIGVSSLFHYQDLKKVMTQALGQGEYYQRYITDIVGDVGLIEDETGRSLDYSDLTWTDFLTRQIKHRITFKYTRSSFPPSEDPVKTLTAAAAASISAYGFTAFEGVVLNDLAEDETTEIGRDEILSTTVK
ncbi:MAG: hypothetical protein ACLFPX_08250 [Candidatus Omnitrophota bacterium]